MHNITTQLKYYQRWLGDGSRWQREQAQASNIITRGRRQQTRRRQRCSRRQQQLRGSRVPRAGLGEEDFFLLKPYRFGYRSVIILGYVFLYVEASMQCDKKRMTRRTGSKWKLSNCWLYKTYVCKWMYVYLWICNMMYKFIILCGRYRSFSSLSFYHGLDMFLATRDALAINGSCQVCFYNLRWKNLTSQASLRCSTSLPEEGVCSHQIDVTSWQWSKSQSVHFSLPNNSPSQTFWIIASLFHNNVHLDSCQSPKGPWCSSPAFADNSEAVGMSPRMHITAAWWVATNMKNNDINYDDKWISYVICCIDG